MFLIGARCFCLGLRARDCRLEGAANNRGFMVFKYQRVTIAESAISVRVASNSETRSSFSTNPGNTHSTDFSCSMILACLALPGNPKLRTAKLKRYLRCPALHCTSGSLDIETSAALAEEVKSEALSQTQSPKPQT